MEEKGGRKCFSSEESDSVLKTLSFPHWRRRAVSSASRVKRATAFSLARVRALEGPTAGLKLSYDCRSCSLAGRSRPGLAGDWYVGRSGGKLRGGAASEPRAGNGDDDGDGTKSWRGCCWMLPSSWRARSANITRRAGPDLGTGVSSSEWAVWKRCPMALHALAADRRGNATGMQRHGTSLPVILQVEHCSVSSPDMCHLGTDGRGGPVTCSWAGAGELPVTSRIHPASRLLTKSKRISRLSFSRSAMRRDNSSARARAPLLACLCAVGERSLGLGAVLPGRTTGSRVALSCSHVVARGAMSL